MKKFILIAVLCFLLRQYAFSQINESDTARFQMRTNLTGNYQKGNVAVLTVKSRLDFSYAPTQSLVFKSQNSSLYQAFYAVEADNDIFSRNYLYFKPKQRFYPFAIGYVSTNYRRRISARYFVGAGVTYQLINDYFNVLKISTSAMYEQTKFNGNVYNHDEYNGTDKINLWRGTLYLAGSNFILKKHLRVYYDVYWQPAFDNANNYRTQLDFDANFPIWKGLSFNVLYAYTHENVVVNKIKQEDKILTFGLAYNLSIKHR